MTWSVPAHAYKDLLIVFAVLGTPHLHEKPCRDTRGGEYMSLRTLCMQAVYYSWCLIYSARVLGPQMLNFNETVQRSLIHKGSKLPLTHHMEVEVRDRKSVTWWLDPENRDADLNAVGMGGLSGYFAPLQWVYLDNFEAGWQNLSPWLSCSGGVPPALSRYISTAVPVWKFLCRRLCSCPFAVYRKIESADCFSKSDYSLLLYSSIVNCPIIYYHSSISTAKIPYDLVKLIGPAMHSPEQAGVANTRELANLATT